MLLRKLCIIHSFNKHGPGGKITTASFPFGQPSLHSCHLVLRMAIKAAFYFVWVKPHSFQNFPALTWSVSAHKLSEEFEVVFAVCRESRSPYKHKHSTQLTKLTDTPCTSSDKAGVFSGTEEPVTKGGMEYTPITKVWQQCIFITMAYASHVMYTA